MNAKVVYTDFARGLNHFLLGLHPSQNGGFHLPGLAQTNCTDVTCTRIQYKSKNPRMHFQNKKVIQYFSCSQAINHLAKCHIPPKHKYPPICQANYINKILGHKIWGEIQPRNNKNKV